MAVDTELPPFRATVAGAWSLVPEAKLHDGPVDTIPEGSYAVTVPQVEAWVAELSGVVAMTLTDWQRLTDEPVEPETTSDRDQLVTYARAVIHNGAASYLEAARHPERASVNDTSYAAVLWQRYTDGLDRLTAWLTRRLDVPGPGDEVPAGAGGASFDFPAPLIGDGLRF